MSSIQKNFLYNVGYQILIVILPLITAPYISRTLGANSVGIYSYTYSVAYYFFIIAMLGITNHGNRSIAAVRDDRKKLSQTFSNIYCIQVVSYCAAIGFYLCYVLFYVEEYQFIALLQCMYIISGLFDISWLYFGLEKFKLTVVRNALIKIATILCIFIFIHKPEDLWKYTLIMAAGTMFSQVYLWIYIRRYIDFQKPKINEVLHHIKPVLILFIPVLAFSLYKIMDKIMLGNLSTIEQVGFYQNAEKIVNIPMGLITALGTVMLPRMSNLMASGNNDKSLDYIRISIKLVTILTSGIAFGLMGISYMFAPVFFGREFAPCGLLIELLSITVFFIGWANVVRTQYLIPKHLDKIYLISTSCGAIANLCINMMLIPKYAAVGAAIGTIVAEAVVFLVQLIYIKKMIPIWAFILKDTPVIIIGFFMMIVVKQIGNVLDINAMALMMQVFVGGIVFCVCIAVYWLLSKDELGKLMIKLLNRGNI